MMFKTGMKQMCKLNKFDCGPFFQLDLLKLELKLLDYLGIVHSAKNTFIREHQRKRYGYLIFSFIAYHTVRGLC